MANDRGQCVFKGYCECPAKVPQACICNMMPWTLFLKYLKEKYGEENIQCQPDA